MSLKAREIGLAIAPGGYVYMPPLVGGFVGSDLLAVALATRIDRKPGVRLALDIGTNTELLLSVDGRLFSCSTASGPALGRRRAALRLRGGRRRGGSRLAEPGRRLHRLPHDPRQAGDRHLRVGHRRGAGLHGAGRDLQRIGRIQAGKPGVSRDRMVTAVSCWRRGTRPLSGRI